MQHAFRPLAWSLFAAASLILAWEPARWLVRSWQDPAYDSIGYIYAGAVAALALRAVLSGQRRGIPSERLGLFLVLAAGLRLAAQLLAINLVGGIALAADLYALAKLAGLERRPVPIAPFWLSVLFLFSLPVEAVVERLLGFPLQMLSAQLSCALLGLVFEETACAGIRITLAGQDVLVDLPCAGASGLLLLLGFFVAMNVVMRPRWSVTLVWLAVTLTLALLGNSLRIALLAAGLAHGIDTMAEPLHSLTGLVTLALSAVPLALWYRPAPARPPAQLSALRPISAPVLLGAGVACFVAALWIVAQPARPVDISRPVAPAALPAQLAGQLRADIPLSPLENRYFRAYGGDAQKAQYGPLGLTRIRTTSPLRHLHSPDACLRGLGFDVTFLGTRHDGAPAAIYRATGPDGRNWQVAVTFIAPDGRMVPSIGEAVWLWLNGQDGHWTALQRITPLGLPTQHAQALEAAAFAALDLSPSYPQDIEEPSSWDIPVFVSSCC
ncbi:exosortase T [Tropicimonas sp. TH_r6]|uniref:exosortase T n=1 Tax=Tropicimonas sp. TH_r6 TaxID=3082085 RepID=UPI00295506F1|nr:exosortase T [Tropicimonas sp. TH_r6]MDV7141199.1 exosortase T [Tropicimonas sp. TH_r6]